MQSAVGEDFTPWQTGRLAGSMAFCLLSGSPHCFPRAAGEQWGRTYAPEDGGAWWPDPTRRERMEVAAEDNLHGYRCSLYVLYGSSQNKCFLRKDRRHCLSIRKAEV